MCGSPYWIPPEMIKGEPHSFLVDVWSTAVCLLELLIQDPPLHGNTLLSMFTVATRGLAHTIPPEVSQECKEFLTLCLAVDPNQRSDASMLLKHPWVTQPNLEDGIVKVLKSVFLCKAIAQLNQV